MKCLIDADILAYEISACGVVQDPETGETIIKGFDYVADLLHQRIKEIEAECWATEPSTLYLTGDSKLWAAINKRRRFSGEDEIQWTPNFRKNAAQTKPYKANRAEEKPVHFDNLRAYMLTAFDVVVSNGCEADDMIGIELAKAGDKLDVICCTRDKDLRQVPGMHFGWPCGKQPQYGPKRVSALGELELSEVNTLKGCGRKFFWAQMVTGDTVDNIPGLKRGGPVLAYKTLAHLNTEAEMLQAVCDLYRERHGEGWPLYMQEQADLLYITQTEEECNDRIEKYNMEPICL